MPPKNIRRVVDPILSAGGRLRKGILASLGKGNGEPGNASLRMRLSDADPAHDNHVEHAVLGMYQLTRPIRFERLDERIPLLEVVLPTT